jgi:hypothetical protein
MSSRRVLEAFSVASGRRVAAVSYTERSTGSERALTDALGADAARALSERFGGGAPLRTRFDDFRESRDYRVPRIMIRIIVRVRKPTVKLLTPM